MRVNTNPDKADEKYAAVLTDDVFFSSKIREAAKSQGLAADFIKSTDGLIERLASHPPSLIIIDLNCRKLEPVRLISEIKSNPSLKGVFMIGYLPHVETDLKRMASEAGCDMVLPRSRFAREAGEILMRFTSG
jgi:CheY-like chemotaxis protein